MSDAVRPGDTWQNHSEGVELVVIDVRDDVVHGLLEWDGDGVGQAVDLPLAEVLERYRLSFRP